MEVTYSPLRAVDVCGEVLGQIICSGKAFATHFTVIGTFTCMDA
jgi:hypothetical protein